MIQFATLPAIIIEFYCKIPSLLRPSPSIIHIIRQLILQLASDQDDDDDDSGLICQRGRQARRYGKPQSSRTCNWHHTVLIINERCTAKVSLIALIIAPEFSEVAHLLQS